MKRPGEVVVGEIVGLGCQVALFLLLVPRLSIVGAALSSFGGYTVAAAITVALFVRSPQVWTGTASALEAAA